MIARKQILALVLAVTLIPWAARAEEDEDARDPLEEEQTWTDGDMGLTLEEEFMFSEDIVVVSASKYLQPINEAPSTIHVVTAADIRASGLTNLADILRTVPGLDVMAMTATDVEVSARGLNQALSNKMLVMIDGRSVFNTSYNFVIWNALPIVLDEIQRVEVILGPGSALYGANAFTGVVSIITKNPDEARGVHARASVGNKHSYHHSLLHGGSWKNLGWKVSAGWDETDRWTEQVPADHMASYNGQDRVPGESGDVLHAGTTLTCDLPRDVSVRLSGGLVHGGSELLVQAENGVWDVDPLTGFGSVTLDRRELQLTAYYEYGEMDWIPLNITSNEPYLMRYSVADLNGQYTLDPADWCKFTLGGNYRMNRIKWGLLDQKHDITDMSGFLQGVFWPMKHLSVTLGGRYDNYDTVGARESYRGSLVWSPMEGHTFRFSLGNAFRNPSYLESYMYLSTSLFAGRNILVHGTEDLDPEAIMTYEVAFLGRFFEKRVNWTWTMYYNEYEDFIFTRVLDTFEPFGIPVDIGMVNFGAARAYGGEFGVTLNVTGGLSGFANYSYQRIEFTKDDPFTPANEEGRRVTTSPTHKVNLGLRFRLRSGFSGNVNAHYVHDTDWTVGSRVVLQKKLDDYVLVNAHVAYKFWQDRLEVGLTGTNLLHDKHQEFPLGDQIGSTLLLSFRLDYGGQE